MPDIISSHLGNGSFYNKAYTVRREASSHFSNATSWFNKNAKNIFPEDTSDTRMLSIGCGNGELELALLDACPEHTVHFLGLEPSGDMRSEFIQNISMRNNKFQNKKNFTLSDAEFASTCAKGGVAENFAPFDVVILGHVLYYFDDPTEVIRKARELTRDDGRVLVVHQAAKGIPEVQEVITPALRGAELTCSRQPT